MYIYTHIPLDVVGNDSQHDKEISEVESERKQAIKNEENIESDNVMKKYMELVQVPSSTSQVHAPEVPI